MSTPARIFLDANILFSAAKSDGAIRRMLKLLHARGHVCVADPYVIEEARRNLGGKYAESLPVLVELIRQIETVPLLSAPDTVSTALPLPPKDRPVLAAAILHGCTHLVTGDQTHFGPLFGHTVAGVRLCSPRQLAEALLA